MKCPECEQEIEELMYEESKAEVGNVTLDLDGALKYDEILGAGHSLDMKYMCGHCEAELDLDDEGAMKLLQEIAEK